ncbi:MAG: (2Fe-2S)-binding protein [Coriobacteriia bacterium]|nr:(2Fe-2S)-binding protein [Coriobacteriia bacterium]
MTDFIVRTSAPGFVSALGIKNPGLTASPALAKRAVALLREEGLVARERTGWLPQRTRYVPFLSRSEEEQARLAREDPSFDHVICRCELVTEGDVRAVMRGPLPPSTIAGMRRRLRCGMGRCQGGFCLPRVLAIMADELGVPAEQVPWGEGGASLSSRKVKR